MEFEPIQVMRGAFGPFPGIRVGRVAAYEFPLRDVDYVRPGQLRRDRSYLLLDEGIQMSCPPGFSEEQAGWWYVDLVGISEDGNQLEVVNQYLDVIVGPPDHCYRVLDMDEFGDAIERLKLTRGQAVTGLRNFQRFLDNYLNRRHDTSRSWPDFPPRSIRPLAGWRTELFPEGAPAVWWD